MSKEMNQSIGMVAEFHRTYNHPIANNVGDETLKVRQLRIKLLFEELQELAEATDCERTFIKLCDDSAYKILDKNGGVEISNDEFEINQKEVYDTYEILDGDQVDHVAELDALCDLQYVLDGKTLTSGHWKHFNQAFSEVHRSNMSKACETEEEASMEVYKLTNKGINVHKELHNGKWVLVRNDKKVLKGPHFKEPDLKRFVMEYKYKEGDIIIRADGAKGIIDSRTKSIIDNKEIPSYWVNYTLDVYPDGRARNTWESNIRDNC